MTHTRRLAQAQSRHNRHLGIDATYDASIKEIENKHQGSPPGVRAKIQHTTVSCATRGFEVTLAKNFRGHTSDAANAPHQGKTKIHALGARQSRRERLGGPTSQASHRIQLIYVTPPRNLL